MEELLYIEIGKLIKKARNLKGMTQEELSEQVGLTRVSITNIEKGNQKISISNLYLIGEALSVNPKTLIPDPVELQRENKLFGEIEALKGKVTLKDYEIIKHAVTKVEEKKGDESNEQKNHD